MWKDETNVNMTIVWIYVSYLREKLESIDADIQIIGERGKEFLLTERRK